MTTAKKNKVLIADDQPEMLELLGEKLRALGKEVIPFSAGTALVRYLEEQTDGIQLVVLDLDFGPGKPDGIEILKQLKARHAELPVIILTGKGSIDAAVSAVRHGAADFLEKDLDLEDRLELGVEKVERMLQVLRENARLKAENEALDRDNLFYRTELGQRYRVVSASPKIQAILEQVERLASIPRPVLICGERGTGKELIAAALHYGGERAHRPFVKLNCAALSDTLLESELFGHEKGAFTGAVELRRGRFEMADGGTLFLDEIGNTSLDFQKNVLRVIEYQEFERIGGTRTIAVNVRVVAATNAELQQEISQGRFRADLYDRLRFSVIQLPPLRERLEDVRPMIAYFTRQLADEVPSIARRSFNEKSLLAMEAHSWPGNVRELKFAVERSLCVARGSEVEPHDLPAEVLGKSDWGPVNIGDFDERLESLERNLLNRGLQEAGGSQKEAAQALGLTYDRFRHLLRKHGLIGKDSG